MKHLILAAFLLSTGTEDLLYSFRFLDELCRDYSNVALTMPQRENVCEVRNQIGQLLIERGAPCAIVTADDGIDDIVCED